MPERIHFSGVGGRAIPLLNSSPAGRNGVACFRGLGITHNRWEGAYTQCSNLGSSGQQSVP